jgi:hypothetical protein
MHLSEPAFEGNSMSCRSCNLVVVCLRCVLETPWFLFSFLMLSWFLHCEDDRVVAVPTPSR